MTTPTFTEPPTAPQRSDTDAVFVSRADAFVAWFATLYAELVALVAWLVTTAATIAANAVSAAASAVTASAAASAAISTSNYFDTIPTSLAIGSGAKNLTGIVATLAAANGEDWSIVSMSNAGNRMHGVLSSVNLGAGTATMTVASDGYAGSGSPTDWLLIPTALLPLLTGLGSDLRAGLSAIAGMTPAAIFSALATVTLTDAATIAVDMSTFINAKVTLGGNRTLGNPSNTIDGKSGRIRIIQDGTGSRTLSYASNWKPIRGVAPTLTTTAGAYDVLEYEVLDNGDVLFDVIAWPH